MSDEDVQRYLNRPRSPASDSVRPVRGKVAAPAAGGAGAAAMAARRRAASRNAAFENFSASQIFCPRCRQAMPVRERVLLYLPDGNLHEYLCHHCGTSLGTRKT